MAKPLSELTRSALLRAIDNADTLHQAACDEMIAAGRGHERLGETRTKTDALSGRLIRTLERCSELEGERRQRLTFHGSEHRITTRKAAPPSTNSTTSARATTTED